MTDEEQDGRELTARSVSHGALSLTGEGEERGKIPCPVCGFPIGAVRGSKAAICQNCGFKDGCC